MHSFSVKAAGGGRSAGCAVHVGIGLLSRLGELAAQAGIKPGRAAIVSDSRVAPLYLAAATSALKGAGFDPIAIEVPAGETSKSLQQLSILYDRFVEAGLTRSNPVF